MTALGSNLVWGFGEAIVLAGPLSGGDIAAGVPIVGVDARASVLV
jgi:hypothetical protein